MSPQVCLVLAMGLVGCAPSISLNDPSADSSAAVKSKSSAVQMNDVSILLPIAKSASEANSYLTAASNGEGGVLLPPDIFSDVVGKVRGINGAPTYDQLRVVALRLDPCFAQIGPVTDPSTCQHELRLIFQPMQGDGTSANPISFDDSGFHAFYALDADTFTTLLDAVVALRRANSKSDLGPLDVHPIIAKQGLDGAMGKGLSALVLKYAGEANLSRVTGFIASFAEHTTWSFAADDITDGALTASPIFGIAGTPTQESVSLGTAPTGLIALQFPATTTSDDVAVLVSANAQAATDDQRMAAFDSALRIENPDFNSPNTTDCASCHVAQIARQLIGQDFFDLSVTGDANLFAPDSQYVSAKDFASDYQATQPNGLAANLHAFSYDGTAPMIIQRVVNESAAIVAYLNAPAS